MRAGRETESVEFGKLAAGPEAKCLIGLFESMNELKKPAGGKPRAVDRIAILGGGFMGSGIAAVSIPHVPTVVKDISDEVLARCGKSIDDGLRKRMRSGAISRFDRDVQWTRLLMTTDPADLAGTDLVIEAVFENLDLKRKILAETEAVVSPTTVFASNTSALPIGSIAENATHPERVLGMHYFSPVPKMPLLELIVTDRTAPWATATARAVGVRQGKTVVVVKDGPGFYTSRILGPFLGEAVELLREGARIPDVDKALKNFGYRGARHRGVGGDLRRPRARGQRRLPEDVRGGSVGQEKQEGVLSLRRQARQEGETDQRGCLSLLRGRAAKGLRGQRDREPARAVDDQRGDPLSPGEDHRVPAGR
jgi:hypothetical protein